MQRSARAALAALASITLAALPVHAQTISTLGGWNGSSHTRSFGYPNTATYGQTFTAPGGELTSFSFWLSDQDSNTPISTPSQLPFVAHVYGWDPVTGMATGSDLFTSATYYGSVNGNGFDRYDFAVPGLNLPAGDMFVAFLSTSGLGSLPAATNSMGTGSFDYAGGSFVFLNNGNDASQWTSQAWVNNFCGAGCDAAFEATFRPTTVTPEPSSVTLLASGLLVLAGVGIRRRRLATPRG